LDFQCKATAAEFAPTYGVNNLSFSHQLDVDFLISAGLPRRA